MSTDSAAAGGAGNQTTTTQPEGLTQQEVNPQLDLAAALASPPTPTPFGTKEILWFSIGKWGEAGYALWNSGGKNGSGNSAILGMVENIGKTLFELMHQPDVYQARPPQKTFLWEVYQMVFLVQKRMNDAAITYSGPNQQRLDSEKSAPANQQFLVYPIPYFGDRVQQPDVKAWAQICLQVLSEMAQHEDNKYSNDITGIFAARMNPFFNRILYQMATKYFGYTAASYQAATQIPDPANAGKFLTQQFALKDADWTNYDPTNKFLSSEFTSSLPPLQWMPTDQDLSVIRGLPYGTAIKFGQRWSSDAASMYGTGGGSNYTPGTGQLRQDGSSSPNAAGQSSAAPISQANQPAILPGSPSGPPQ